jgi:hypothetical protein
MVGKCTLFQLLDLSYIERPSTSLPPSLMRHLFGYRIADSGRVDLSRPHTQVRSVGQLNAVGDKNGDPNEIVRSLHSRP